MAKVSIVVPVYNAEKYLDQCVESLVQQTYKNIEILLVDDGSKDCSCAICDKWAQADSRIVVIHKQNAGACIARKDGIAAATGKYVCFLDSDDYAQPTFCQKMLEQMVNNNADLVECAYSIFSDVKETAHLPWAEMLNLNRDAFLDQVVRNTIVSGTEAVIMWNKMYLRQNIMDYVKDYGQDVLEDYLFNMQYYTGVQKYVYIPQCLVNYRQVSNSLSRRCNLKTFEILKAVDAKKTSCLQEMGLTTPADNRQAALWFVQYTYSFLVAYLQSVGNVGKRFARQILEDPVLVEKCECISTHHNWARLIAVGRYRVAYRRLKQKAMRNRIIRQLAAVKAKLKG